MRLSNLLAVNAVVVASCATMFAQTSPGWTPTLELRAVRSFGDGTSTSGTQTWTLVKGGEPIAAAIGASGSLCMISAGGATMAEPPSTETSWRMDAEFLGEQAGRYQLRVTSKFTRLAGASLPAPFVQTLSLGDGDEVTVDVVRATEDGPCHARNLTMQARVVMRSTDPALTRARYSADLWLVHTDAAGQERRQHVTLPVVAGSAQPFTFDALAFPIPQLDPRQGDMEAFLRVTGSVLARPRPNGAVDVVVDTVRHQGLQRSGSSKPPIPGVMGKKLVIGIVGEGLRTQTGAMGRKLLTMRESETTAIDFPPANGYSVMAIGPDGLFSGGADARDKNARELRKILEDASGRPVELRRDSVVLYTGRFFKGHRTQLLIRLQKPQ